MPPRPPMNRGMIAAIASKVREKAGISTEAARMLPDSKGGETPMDLQRYRTDIFSYFTRSTNETELLYSAENWVRIKLVLQSAGPVAIGTSQNIVPVLSGLGVLLDTDVPYEAYLAKGTRIWITSQTINRISVQVEPIPWLEQLDADTVASNSAVRDMVSRGAKAIINAIDMLRGVRPATSSSGVSAADQPTPAPPGQRLLGARLTQVPGARKMR